MPVACVCVDHETEPVSKAKMSPYQGYLMGLGADISASRLQGCAGDIADGLARGGTFLCGRYMV